MRAVLPVHHAGGEGSAAEPRLGELPDPTPGEGEVQIEVRATALNQADLLQLRGAYPPPAGESAVPGLECAGVVSALGAGVDGVAVGDRVMALLAGGGHASLAVAPVGQLVPLPGNLSFTEAAALPEACLTAWTNLVVEGGLHRGQTVLVTGAASGVGTMAVQVARELGAHCLVAGRSRDRLERLRPLGADGVCLLGEGLVDEVRALNRGRGVDLVLDLVGGPHLEHHLQALDRCGRLVLVGLMGGRRAELELGPLMARRVQLVGSVLRSRSRAEKAGLVAGFRDFADERLCDGRLKPVVDRVLPFDDIVAAYDTLRQGGLFGKLVLEV